MERYDSYKDSGVKWLGEIPSHWDSASLLYLLRSKISDGPHETPNLIDDGIPFISIDSLNDSKEIDFSVVKKYISSKDYDRYCNKTILEKGDVLFSKAATIGKTAIVGEDKFMVWSPLAILKPNYKKITSLYLYYIMNCKKAIEEVCLLGSKNTQINVGMRELEKIRIPIPTLNEQIAISEFLDQEISKIDAAIAQQQKMIDLLNERKQIIINNAVTKGLDPFVSYKESSFELLCKIPEHWDIIKLKYIAEVRGRVGFKGYSASDLVDEGAYSIGGKHISNNKIDLSDPTFISWHKYYESPEIMVKKGDILTAQRGSLGHTAIVEEDIGPSTINPSLVLITNIKCHNKFLYWYLLSDPIMKIIEFLNTATAVPMLSQRQIENMPIVLPPSLEQESISSYLEKEISHVEDTIGVYNRKISLLQERKQIIINDVVTGKVKIV